MKLLLLVAFVAACTASSLVRSRTVSVEDDGSYIITNSFSGRRVQLYKPTQLNGQQVFEVRVSEPNFPSKVIRIYEGPVRGAENKVSDEVRQKGSFSKVILKDNGDAFFLILKDYTGLVTDSEWVKFLTRVEGAVRQGVVVPEIYDLLIGLDIVEANYIWKAIEEGQQDFGRFLQEQSGYAQQNPRTYFQSQFPGPYSSQFYQGQYPYYQSQYQEPYNSQYYKGEYPYYQSQSQGPFNSQYKNLNQQPFQEVSSTTYPKKPVEFKLHPITQQKNYDQQPQSYFGQYSQNFYSQQQPQNLLNQQQLEYYGQLQNDLDQFLQQYYINHPQTYFGQYFQRYYSQQQPQSYLNQDVQDISGPQRPDFKQYYGQNGQSQNYLGQYLEQYYGQKQPVYGQQQQFYGQNYPNSQQYSAIPSYQQTFPIPQNVF